MADFLKVLFKSAIIHVKMSLPLPLGSLVANRLFMSCTSAGFSATVGVWGPLHSEADVRVHTY